MAQKVIILGAGESGVGAALLAQKKGFSVWVSDKNKIAEKYKKTLKDYNVSFEEGKHTLDKVFAADLVIKSPGIPDEVPLIQQLYEKGIEVISEIEFASRYTKAKIIAITGTNGKTTTTLLTYHLLKENKLDVCCAGNIGKSFAWALFERDYDFFVLEVSSFQLDQINSFAPNVAVLLNITADHLDRYGYKMERYIASKCNIVQFMSTTSVLIYNADDEHIASFYNKNEVQLKKEPFSSSFITESGGIDVLVSDASPSTSNSSEGEVFAQEGQTRLRFDHLPLKGPHNCMNISAAVQAAWHIGLKYEQIKEALITFKNVPHRLELVNEVTKISFINDSKATNVDAVYYALNSFGNKKIVWIAGGIDKGNDYDMIRELVHKNVRALVCLGKDNAKLHKAFDEDISYIIDTDNMGEAVLKAYHLAERGDVILLSPACSSFDLFKNYEDRGDQFKSAVNKLITVELPKKV